MVLLPQLSSEALIMTQNYQNAGIEARQGVVVMNGPAVFWTRSFGHAQFCQNISNVPQGTIQG